MSLILSVPFKSKVSSTLNKDIKQFGKEHLFDQSEETCWNSSQGSPQWVHIAFENEVDITAIHLMFQGGFVSELIEIWAGKDSLEQICIFYPKDNNTLQQFPIHITHSMQIKIVFPKSTDFFGRITIYKLDLIGNLSVR